MVIDFTKQAVVHRDLEIDGKKVERVDKYKYLALLLTVNDIRYLFFCDLLPYIGKFEHRRIYVKKSIEFGGLYSPSQS